MYSYHFYVGAWIELTGPEKAGWVVGFWPHHGQADGLPRTRRFGQAFDQAQDAQRRMKAPQIRPEHLLLGVALTPAGLGGQALRTFQVTPDPLWSLLRTLSDIPPATNATALNTVVPLAGIAPTSADPARDALATGAEVARRLEHPYIGTGHLLVGLLDHATPAVIAALGSAGASPGRLREWVMARMV